LSWHRARKKEKGWSRNRMNTVTRGEEENETENKVKGTKFNISDFASKCSNHDYTDWKRIQVPT
jgi:hypothetical protein